MSKVTTLSGQQGKVNSILRKYRMDYKKVKVINEFYSRDHDHCSITISCIPYTPEEHQEIDMYGDPDHESYLMSDDYTADYRSEQWDWLKNA